MVDWASGPWWPSLALMAGEELRIGMWREATEPCPWRLGDTNQGMGVRVSKVPEVGSQARAGCRQVRFLRA